jgi:hypothetical protein
VVLGGVVVVEGAAVDGIVGTAVGAATAGALLAAVLAAAVLTDGEAAASSGWISETRRGACCTADAADQIASSAALT